MAVMDVDERLVTVAESQPNVTTAPARNPVPWMVTAVPPADGPPVGFIDQAVGAAT